MNKALKLFILFKSKLYIKGLFKGCAAAIEHENVLLDLNCDLIVDVGANKGQFALAARSCFPKAKIVSFEPLDDPANKYLCVFKDDANVKLYKVAIGAEKSEASIHVSKSVDSSSLLPITSTQSQLFPGTEEDHVETINVDVLENYIDENEIDCRSLLKVDVQGYELEVLIGSISMLKCFEYIYVECSFVELYEGQAFASKVIDFLHKNYFVLHGVYNMCYDHDGKAIQADFLFRKISTDK